MSKLDGILFLGALGTLGGLVWTAIDVQLPEKVYVQAGENVYLFRYSELDKTKGNADTEDHLQAMYEKVTIPTWMNASTAWTMEPLWCSPASSSLSQCYDLARERKSAYAGYQKRILEDQKALDALFEKNNGETK